MAKAAAAAAKKPLTKTELMANIATATELSKKQVAAVLEALAAEIQKSLSNKGAGAITIPGLVKIEKKKVPAKAGPEERAQSLQAGRILRHRRPSRPRAKSRSAPEDPEGLGQVVSCSRLSAVMAA